MLGKKMAPINNKGFSLLELVFVMLVIGFSLTVIAQFLKIYIQKQRHDFTIDNVKITEDALAEYFALQGRYPCPADPTLPPAHAQYGRERCRPNVAVACPPAPAGGIPVSVAGPIKCTNTESRDANNDGTNDIVTIGLLPFKDIYERIVDTPFTTNNAQDAFSMGLTYAVSERMTATTYSVIDPANAHLGAIDIIDENGLAVLDPPKSAHYILVSHGDNRLGGYTKAGARFSKCLQGLAGDPPETEPAPGLNLAGVAPEKENCDNNDAIFVAGLRSTAEGSDYYDDTVGYTSGALKSHWAYSLANSTVSKIYNTNLGNVGVGINDPSAKLHVKSKLSAEKSVGAVKYCEPPNYNDCMFSSAVAGLGSTCANGKVAVGIENNALKCQNLFLSAPGATCPPGEFLTAISNKGNIKCSSL